MTDPRYILLGNGRVATEFFEHTAGRAHPPALLVLNAADRQRCAAELRALAYDGAIPVKEWSTETRNEILEQLSDGQTWLLSVYFAHVLDTELLDAAGGRAVNLHASLLPWFRGAHTNVWPLVERGPAGVSLHLMVPAVDAGAILAQREIPVRPWDTAATLYDRLEAAAVGLLKDEWPAGVLQASPGRPQSGGGSMHRVRDLAALDRYDLDAHPDARALFDLLRARTFPPHGGLKLTVDGQCVEARIELKACTHE